MSTATLALLALGLAMDAFAVGVAVSIALGSVGPHQLFRLAFHLGLFQGLMPIVGWLAGRRLGSAIMQWDHWVAFGLLVLIGGRAVYAAGSSRTWNPQTRDPTRGLTLVGLSLATSMDALAVGVSLAMLRVEIWRPSLVIGVVAAALTAGGMLLGARLGARFGKRSEAVGGLILIGIGIKILMQDLL